MIRISCALVRSALTEAIFTGSAVVDGLQLDLVEVASATEGSAKLLAGDVDAGEMSLAYCLQAIGREFPIVAFPIFPVRRLYQPCAVYGRRTGITAPADLRGRAVGVGQYWATPSIWHRDSLEKYYGVTAASVEWHQCGDAYFPLDGVPPGIQIVTHKDVTPMELLAEGTIEALLGATLHLVDDEVVNLYGNPVAAAVDDYAESGVLPVVHAIAARRAVVEADPDLAELLAATFEQAKAQAAFAAIESPIPGKPYDEALRLLGIGDAYPIGYGPNEAAVEHFLDIAFDQGLTSYRVDVSEAFVS